MTLTKFKNEAPTSSMGRFTTFNELFNELFENSVTSDFKRWSSPAVNVIAYDDKYELQVAAPGFSKEDFKINVEGDRLTISAEKKTEKEEAKGKFTRKEFQLNAFNRSFTLPDEINMDDIKASYENGIMILHLQKHPEVKPSVKEIRVF